MIVDLYILLGDYHQSGETEAIEVWKKKPTDAEIGEAMYGQGIAFRNFRLTHLGLNQDNTCYVIIRERIEVPQ